LHLDFGGTFDGFQNSGFTNCCGGPTGGGPRPDLRPYAVQFGDAQRKPEGVQVLYRLATQVFISLDSAPDRSTVLANLTGPGKPLEGFTLDFDSGMNFILVAPASLAAGLVACPASGQTLIESARQVPGVKIANPVFFSLDSNLRFMPRDDYILHLKTDVDVKAVVPAGRLIQPLDPLSNQFVVQVPGVTWEDLIREVNVLTLDQRVGWAEPNYDLEVTSSVSGPAAQFGFDPVASSNTQTCFPEQVRLSASVSEGAQNITLTVSAVHNRIVTIQKSIASGWAEVTNSVGGEVATFTLPFENESGATLFRALAY